MSQLFVTNVPCDCQDLELKQFVESRGFEVNSVRIVRDLVSGTSPSFGYVTLRNDHESLVAIQALSGQNWKGRTLQVQSHLRFALARTVMHNRT